MSIRLTHNGLPADITPFKLKRFLKQAQSMLRLSKGAVQYLEFAIESCHSTRYDIRHLAFIGAAWSDLSSVETK
jgi:replication initiation protein RepC